MAASSGCLGCHKIGENGNTLGPEPDRDRRPARPGRDRPHAGEPDRADAARTRAARGQAGAVRRARRVPRLAQIRVAPHERRRPRAAPWRSAGAGDVRPHRRRLRPHELGHDRRDAPPLARARGRPGRAWGPATARSTWPPAPATWRSRWPARGRRRARWSGSTSPSGCSSWRGAKAPGDPLRAGQRARARPTRDGAFDAVTVGLRRAQLLRPAAGAWPRWRAWPGPAAGWWCSRSRPRSGRRCRGSSRSGSTASVPLLGRLAGDPDAYTYLPSSVRRFPGPRELAAELAGAGLVDVRWVLTAGGIIAIHAGRKRVSAATPAEQLGAVLAAGGPRARAPAGAHRGAAGRGGRGPRRRRWPSTPAGTLARGRQAPAPDARVPLRRRGATAGCVAAAVAVELLHMATLVHDDVLDRAPLRRGRPTVFAEGGRGAARPPATCSSRAPSPSWPPPAAREAVRRAVRGVLGAWRAAS